MCVEISVFSSCFTVTMKCSLLSLFADHDRLLLGTEDGLCAVELNKDSKLCHVVV